MEEEERGTGWKGRAGVWLWKVGTDECGMMMDGARSPRDGDDECSTLM